MEFQYNREYSQKVLWRVSIIILASIVIGLLLGLFVLLQAEIDGTILAISLGFSSLAGFLVYYLMVLRKWHERMSSRHVIFRDEHLSITMAGNNSEIPFAKVKSVQVMKNPREEIISIKIEANTTVSINRLIINLNNVLSELERRLPDIEFKVKRNSRAMSVLVAISTVALILAIYYFRVTSDVAVVKAIAGNLLPIAGGVFLLVSRPQNNPLLRRVPKAIGGILLIAISLKQIIEQLQ